MVSSPARGNKHIRFLSLLAGLAVVRPFAVDIQNWEKVSSVPVGTNGTTTMQMISLSEYPEVSVHICSERALLLVCFPLFFDIYGVFTRARVLCARADNSLPPPFSGCVQRCGQACLPDTSFFLADVCCLLSQMAPPPATPGQKVLGTVPISGWCI